MNASLNTQDTDVSETCSSRLCHFFSVKIWVKLMKTVFPVAVIAAFLPDIAMAAGASGKDLMATGDETVGKTFGSGSSVVKWVVLAEVLVGAIMYMTTKNIKFLAGFAILSVFIAIGMSVAGY